MALSVCGNKAKLLLFGFLTLASLTIASILEHNIPTTKSVTSKELDTLPTESTVPDELSQNVIESTSSSETYESTTESAISELNTSLYYREWNPEIPSVPTIEDRQFPLPLLFYSSATNFLVNTVIDEGMEMTNSIIENLERHLFDEGITLQKTEPASFLASFSHLKPQAKPLALQALVSVTASHLLSERFHLSRDQIVYGLRQLDISATALGEICPSNFNFSSLNCLSVTRQYRTADGSCNNELRPDWGQSLTAFARFLPPFYGDGVSEPRVSVTGEPLPSARLISTTFIKDENHTSHHATLMLMQWGQFLDHDLTHSAVSVGYKGTKIKCCGIEDKYQHPACLPIIIPPNDPYYSHFNSSCMEFVRSSPAPRENCKLGPQEQVNQVTSFLDASNVFGSTYAEEHSLREFKGGRLKQTSFGNRKSLLPPAEHGIMEDCEKRKDNMLCFKAGDGRVNEQSGLTAMHTLWMREHNHLALHLSVLNPHWGDERLYQEARKIVGAEMQHITYNEFLPLILGETVSKIFGLRLQKYGFYLQYNSSVDPSVANVFGAAAFRFGHSLIQGVLKRYHKDHRPHDHASHLRSEFFRPGFLFDLGNIDHLLLGLSNQPAQEVDEHITAELCNHLFQINPDHLGMDLFAINIQRGRDHGIASYNSWRKYCGLLPLSNFNDLKGLMDDLAIKRLKYLYRDVNDIDLFAAGLAEKPVIGGMIGPTFACIIALQFSKLRQGDRFWYENGSFRSSFSPTQLQEIRKSSLARVLCDNLDEVDSIQLKVMELPNLKWNPRVHCSGHELPSLDLTKWKL